MKSRALLLLAAWPALAAAADSLASGDAVVRFDAATTSWTCETRLVHQRVQLAAGRFRLVSLRNQITGTDFASSDSDEFRFVFANGERSGSSGEYRLVGYHFEKLPVPKASPGIEPGVTLAIDLEHPLFRISLHYDVYASTPRTPLGMIRKWYTVTNRTAQTQVLGEIGIIRMRLKQEFGSRLSLCYWQGGGAQQGTNSLHVEPLKGQRNRTFYSLSGAPGFRTDDVYSGSATYHPYFVLEDADRKEGIFLGFNYLGPWSASIWNAGDYPGRAGFLVGTQLELHNQPLAPGASFEAPNSFLGVFRGDLDEAGEQLQDWQATYKWDYTRESYLWTTGIYNGHWNDSGHKQRTDLHTQEMWRIADLCLRTGAAIAHEDDFWFDQRGRGVWEGIDWKELVSFLRQSGIIFRLWMPPQHFAPGTPPDVDHPDWALVPKAPDGITGWYGLGFCAAAPGAHDYMRRFILDREQRYGTFYYRLDGWIQAPCWATNHDHPAGQPHVQQYRHYLQMLREVKDANPAIGIQGCNSGGEWANWDKMELLENQQPSDGGGPDDLYYLSYFWPIAKQTAWGIGSTRVDDKSWEALATDVLWRRFFHQQGIFDRYMRVYHPAADGAPTQHTYLELTNATRTRAAILQDALPKGEVVVYPKALIADTSYAVAFRYNPGAYTAAGAELMKQGIRFRTTQRQEIILLNLNGAPGRGTDHVAPTAPGEPSIRTETWNSRNGVGVRWSPSQDNGLLAGYEILRDGKLIDRVGIGTFYFDGGTDAGLSHSYEVVAIDADGNRSARVSAVRH